MNAGIETELGEALGAVLGTACTGAVVRVFASDDASGAVDEEIAFPAVAIVVSPAIPHEFGDVLHECNVRILLGTHYMEDRKGTAAAAMLAQAREALYDIDAIDTEMSGNVRLMGLSPASGEKPFTPIQPGDVSAYQNLQGYEIEMVAAIAACDEDES